MKSDFKPIGLPERNYCDGESEMVSVRMPVALRDELKKACKAHGWTVTDVLVTLADQYVQWLAGQRSKSRR